MTDGKVGIGTTAPANTLHVNGQTRLGSWAKIMHTGDSTQAGYIGSGSDLGYGDANDLCLRGTDSIKFTTNDGSSDAMTIDVNGKVGIGTATPATTLDVNGTISSFTTNTQIEVWGATVGTQVHFRAATALANRTQIQLKSINQIGTLELYNGANVAKTVLSGYGDSYFTGGDVGIGTDAPVAKLHIKGTTATNEASHILFENTQGAKKFAIGGGGSGVTNNGLGFRNVTDNTLPMIIDDAGKVGIGTTAPERRLHVEHADTTTKAALAIENSYVSGADASVWFKTVDREWTIGIDESNSGAFTFSNNSVLGTTDRVTIQRDGNVGIGTTTPSADLEVSTASGGEFLVTRSGNSGVTLQQVNGGDATSGSLSIKAGTAMVLYTNGTGQAVYINSSQNVGLGVVPESDWDSAHTALQIGLTSSIISGTASTGWTQLMKNARYVGGGVYKYITTDEASRYNQKDDGTHHFDVAASGTADAAISWTTALTIANNSAATFSSTVSGRRQV